MIKINLKQLRGAAVLAIIKDTKGNYESVTISGKPFFIVTDLKAAENQAHFPVDFLSKIYIISFVSHT